MHPATLLAVVLAPLAALATPVGAVDSDGAMCTQQSKPVKFCDRMNPAPPPDETKARFDKFANAFLVKKDLVEAFSYIAPDYINHHPGVQNGAQAAFDFLNQIWPAQNITVIRTLFEGDQSWLNYVNNFGTIVDRFRWENGCIVEHWDDGEKMPAS